MHEFSLIKSLIKKIEHIVLTEKAKKVLTVHIKLGALSHISAEHFTEHFVHETKNTMIEGASLKVKSCNDEKAKDAQEILLESVELSY